jgi:hypothetical protein
MAEVSPLRRRMIEDMTVRNISPATQRSYVSAVSNARPRNHALVRCDACPYARRSGFGNRIDRATRLTRWSRRPTVLWPLLIDGPLLRPYAKPLQ